MPENPSKKSLKYQFDRFMYEGFANEHSPLYGIINGIIVVLIFYSIVTIVLESVVEFEEQFKTFFTVSEMVVVFIFTLEYAANLYVTKPRRKYALGWWGAIDLLAVLPSYITFMQLAQVIDLRQLKVARILRVLRFLRLMRLLKLAKVVVKDIEEIGKKKYGTLKLDLQIYGIAMLSVLVISSTLTYYAEAEAQPEVFSNIPKAMWWAIITMTTVGYGDMYPITFWGRLVAAGTALCGLALFAMLMNVIGKVMIQGLFGSEDNVDGVEETTTPQETTILDQIRQLAELRDAGILTDEEFTSKKTELLGRV